MRHPTSVLPIPTLLLALLHSASPVFAFKHKPSITSTLELTGLDAATFKLLFVFAVIFILPFLAVLIYTLSKLFLGTYTFRRRLSWAIYPIALGSGLFAASCTLKAVVLSQTRRRTLKKAFNSSVAGVMARFTRKLSFTVLCIALLANVSWRLKDILQRHNTGAISGYVHPEQGVRRRSTSVTESTTPSFVWNDVITRFEGLSGIVVVIMLIATAVPSVLNASSSPSDAEVDISDGFEYVWLGFYGLVSLAYVGVHVWMCVEGHGAYKAYEGYKIGLFGVSPIILIRWIYEVVYTALIIEAHDNNSINLAQLGLADDIVTPLTYLFLLLFVFLVAADGRVDRNASGREGRNTMLRRTARISAEFDKDEY